MNIACLQYNIIGNNREEIMVGSVVGVDEWRNVVTITSDCRKEYYNSLKREVKLSPER